MSLSTLEAVFSDVDSQTTLAIYIELSAIAPKLRTDFSSSQIRSLATIIDKVSNGSGLQIITLYMLPSDEIPESLKSLPAEILSNLTAVNA